MDSDIFCSGFVQWNKPMGDWLTLAPRYPNSASFLFFHLVQWTPMNNSRSCCKMADILLFLWEVLLFPVNVGQTERREVENRGHHFHGTLLPSSASLQNLVIFEWLEGSWQALICQPSCVNAGEHLIALSSSFTPWDRGELPLAHHINKVSVTASLVHA